MPERGARQGADDREHRGSGSTTSLCVRRTEEGTNVTCGPSPSRQTAGSPRAQSQLVRSHMERRHPAMPQRPLVLLVDSRPETLALCALALSATGFNVVPATDGAEAVIRACETRPDIIVTELPMPHYDGWQFLQDLKRSPHTRNIPVVAMSDHVQASIREQPDHDGFAALFTRPCLPGELAEGLRQVLDRKTHAVGGR